MLTVIAEHFNYVVVIVLMMTGLYVVFASDNMVKKLVGLSTFQTSVFLLYITIGKVRGGVPPIIEGLHGGGHAEEGEHGAADAGHGVLILTAIVVGVATLAVGLALVVRIREVYGTIEEAEIDAINYAFNLEGAGEPVNE